MYYLRISAAAPIPNTTTMAGKCPAPKNGRCLYRIFRPALKKLIHQSGYSSSLFRLLEHCLLLLDGFLHCCQALHRSHGRDFQSQGKINLMSNEFKRTFYLE
jgi:hypothetical protein